MIPWLENHGEESVIILSPAGQDQAAPGILSALLGSSLANCSMVQHMQWCRQVPAGLLRVSK